MNLIIIYIILCRPHFHDLGFISVYAADLLILPGLLLCLLNKLDGTGRFPLQITAAPLFESHILVNQLKLSPRWIHISLSFFLVSFLASAVSMLLNGSFHKDILVESIKLLYYILFCICWFPLLSRLSLEGSFRRFVFTINRCVIVILFVLIIQCLEIEPLFLIISNIWSNDKLGNLYNLSRLRFFSTFYNSNWFGWFGATLVPLYVLQLRFILLPGFRTANNKNPSVFSCMFLLACSVAFLLLSGSRSALLSSLFSIIILLTGIIYEPAFNLFAKCKIDKKFLIITIFVALISLPLVYFGAQFLYILPRFSQFLQADFSTIDAFTSRYEVAEITIKNLSLTSNPPPPGEYQYTHNSFLFSLQLFGILPGTLWLLATMSLSIFPFLYTLLHNSFRCKTSNVISSSILMFSVQVPLIVCALSADLFQSTQVTLSALVLFSLAFAYIRFHLISGQLDAPVSQNF